MSDEFVQELKSKIRSIPDWPKKGIIFRDITELLKDGKAFRTAIRQMAERFQQSDVDVVVSAEARGFIFGAPLAYELGVGFVPVRKPGKLPCDTLSARYELEYGYDEVEIHRDGIKPGQRVLIVDDLLATGGTIAATAELVQRLGGKIVGFCFLIELASLGGRKRLAGYDVWSLIKYE